MSANFPVSLEGTRAPVDMWAHPEDVEAQARQQLRDISQLPWVHRVAVMPDVHLGKGATVGSVIAQDGAVSPSAVGVDIGCGMAAIPTNVTADRLDEGLHDLRMAIEAAVPVGFSMHASDVSDLPPDLTVRSRDVADRFVGLTAEVDHLRARAGQQLGTLGGGNHFIEVMTDPSGRVWLMLHSGSRGIGNHIAMWHIERAMEEDQNVGFTPRDLDRLPEDPKARAKWMRKHTRWADPALAVFLADTVSMTQYMTDLYWAQDYARLNRDVMLHLVQRVFSAWHEARSGSEVEFSDPINCHHNYVSEETYDGKRLIVTRKGAISAQAGQLGLIPGSMGTGSWVVEGLGNTAGLCSASHGAGRRFSRTAAKRTFTLEDLARTTDGVECRKDDGVLDEIPLAYKDLGEVIRAQAEGPSPLIRPLLKLDTRLSVKG